MAPARTRTKVERAKQYLRGGGVARDDSDDELGIEDHPWEWIYGSEHADDDDHDAEPPDPGHVFSPSASRARAATDRPGPRRIVGARMGNFSCKVGDAVLLKADGNEAWVGLIGDLFEDDETGDKCANFMWFSTPNEVRNRAKRRTDAVEVGVSSFVYEGPANVPCRTNCTSRRRGTITH